MTSGTEPYLSDPAGQALLAVARQSLVTFVRDQQFYLPTLEDCSPELRRMGASFVTLTNQGVLRGCIGTVEARRPLALDVAHNSVAAASRDPRFAPLKTAELDLVRLSVTVLTTPQTLVYQDYADLLARLRPGIDGVILTHQERRGLLLPQVWSRIPDPADFLNGICEKAGFPIGLLHQSPPQLTVLTFQAQHFYEPGYLEPGGLLPAQT
jgi:AmmeMemoRadiSam system protein A